MQEIYIDNLSELIKNKKAIENKLKVKLTNKGRLVFIEGPGNEEYLACKIIEAIDLGFSLERAFLILNEENIFQTLNLKDLTKRKDLYRIRARLIGTEGRAIKNLSNLTECAIELKDNTIGIIGDSESVEEAIIALTSIIQGSKHSHVYTRLEREKKKKAIDDIKSIKNDLNYKEPKN